MINWYGLPRIIREALAAESSVPPLVREMAGLDVDPAASESMTPPQPSSTAVDAESMTPLAAPAATLSGAIPPISANPALPRLAPPGHRSDDNDLFAAPSPAPGELYRPLTRLQKVGRVLGLVSGAAKRLGESNAFENLNERELQSRQRLGMEREQMGMQRELQTEQIRHARTQEELERIRAQREAELAPLQRQHLQQQVEGYRTPEQEAALQTQYHPLTMKDNATGAIYQYNPQTKTWGPAPTGATPTVKWVKTAYGGYLAPIESAAATAAASGDIPAPIAQAAGLQLTPAHERFEVLHYGEKPFAIRDNDTKQVYSDPAKMSPEARGLFAAASRIHQRTRQERIDDAVRANDMTLARQLAMEKARENATTVTTKSMMEAAPKVLNFVERIRPLIEQSRSKMGPAAGRWSEMWAGKIGAEDPLFTRLRTNVGLLQTLLMRMHVGARGGEYIMQHFENLINSGKQDPDNLLAALGEIQLYANDLLPARVADDFSLAASHRQTAQQPSHIVKDAGGRRIGLVINNQYVPDVPVPGVIGAAAARER
jgi:hypothetical protein